MQIHADFKGKVAPDDIKLWANRCTISSVKHILLGGGYCHAWCFEFCSHYYTVMYCVLLQWWNNGRIYFISLKVGDYIYLKSVEV